MSTGTSVAMNTGSGNIPSRDMRQQNKTVVG